MIEYAASVLKNEAVYYNLVRATIRDGILHIKPGGSAETEITQQQLTSLTQYFRVAYIADTYCDPYESDIRIFVYAEDVDGNRFNITCFPTDTNGNLYMQEFQMKSVKYRKLTYRIESDLDINVSLWELCPEAMSADVQTVIDGVSQSLPRLLYDYNTWPLEVGADETTVGLITFRLQDKTDLQGHFLMSFYASEAAILTVRFYTGIVEELFAPLNYDVRKGYNSIGIPHSYLHRAAGLYTIFATAQVTAGILTIPTRGVLYSIDGGYLAKRELDLAMDIQDVAIRQLSSSFGPDELWVVGLDAGELLVRRRDYDEENPNTAFTPVLTLGKGIAAAIEFDGSWVLRANESRYTIETEEAPWYFWVDEDGVLWGRRGTDETTLVQLAENVSQVRACRGYSSLLYEEQDQGLVVVYIQDGYVYYRQYQYQVSPQEKQWMDPVPLYSSEQFTFANVHRLNDYRLGFELSNDSHNIWIITQRNYVGQSVAPEQEYLAYANTPECIANYPRDYDTSIRVIDSSYEPGDLDVYITYNRLFYMANGIRINEMIAGIDLLVYDSYNEDNNNVKSIEWLPNELNKTTTLHLTLKHPIVPTKLIYQVGVVLNPNNSPFFWAIMDDYGYILFSPISYSWEFDNTQYIYTDQKDEYTLPEMSSTGLQYRQLGYHKRYSFEPYHLPGLTPAGLVYTPLGKYKGYSIETLPLGADFTYGIGYFNKNGEPI